MNTVKGLIVEVYKNSMYGEQPINKFDKFQSLTLVDPAIKGVFEPSEDRPAIIVKRNINGMCEYIHAEPAEPGSYAFGGTFIYCSDGRFRILSKYPIPLHDRQMNLETR